jgi:hypothetical protein
MDEWFDEGQGDNRYSWAKCGSGLSQGFFVAGWRVPGEKPAQRPSIKGCSQSLDE